MEENEILDFDDRPKKPGLKLTDPFIRASFGMILLGFIFKVQHWPYSNWLLLLGFSLYTGFILQKFLFYNGSRFKKELLYFSPFSVLGGVYLLLTIPWEGFVLFFVLTGGAFVMSFMRDKIKSNP